MTTTTTTPLFYTIESATYTGYNLTQRGSHVVLAAKNTDNPFQLWYKDDSWSFLDVSGNPAFVLLNHGSKTALKASLAYTTSTSQTIKTTKVSLASYDPSTQEDALLWSNTGTLAKATITSALNNNLVLGLGVGSYVVGDGIPAIVNASSQAQWSLVPYEPRVYAINLRWYNQYLNYKTPRVSVTVANSNKSPVNDELSVVSLYQTQDAKWDAAARLWYKIPAGGIEHGGVTNSSFIVVNRLSGKALKGSTKPGDKVIAIEYDPLDYDFVWTENREYTTGYPNYVGVNLSSNPNIRWYNPIDSEYQNGSYYHGLTVKQVDNVNELTLWMFEEQKVA